jgi:hypothetical protein
VLKNILELLGMFWNFEKSPKRLEKEITPRRHIRLRVLRFKWFSFGDVFQGCSVYMIKSWTRTFATGPNMCVLCFVKSDIHSIDDVILARLYSSLKSRIGEFLVLGFRHLYYAIFF